MMDLNKYNQFYPNLKAAADNILEVVSNQIGVNTFCVASNDEVTSFIFSAFHREEHLFDPGVNLGFLDAY
ncbi:hypothetical protein ACERII_13885 [Evansella sp. AB-rgal1]|uniref:hypothetical protein n=1 Tax=Evansella sp. AB-rgal1 TaxID=3242696 RepID=UPI00359E40D0